MEQEITKLNAWAGGVVPLSGWILLIVVLLWIWYFSDPKPESFNPTALARGQALDNLGQTGYGLGPHPGCGDVLNGQDTYAWMNKKLREQMADKGAVPGGTRRTIDDTDLTKLAMGQG